MLVFGGVQLDSYDSLPMPPEGNIYKWYISGIYCQLGDYMPPTTL